MNFSFEIVYYTDDSDNYWVKWSLGGNDGKTSLQQLVQILRENVLPKLRWPTYPEGRIYSVYIKVYWWDDYWEHRKYFKDNDEIMKKLDVEFENGLLKCPACGHEFHERWLLYQHYTKYPFLGKWKEQGILAKPSTIDDTKTVDVIFLSNVLIDSEGNVSFDSNKAIYGPSK